MNVSIWNWPCGGWLWTLRTGLLALACHGVLPGGKSKRKLHNKQHVLTGAPDHFFRPVTSLLCNLSAAKRQPRPRRTCTACDRSYRANMLSCHIISTQGLVVSDVSFKNIISECFRRLPWIIFNHISPNPYDRAGRCWFCLRPISTLLHSDPKGSTVVLDRFGGVRAGGYPRLILFLVLVSNSFLLLVAMPWALLNSFVPSPRLGVMYLCSVGFGVPTALPLWEGNPRESCTGTSKYFCLPLHEWCRRTSNNTIPLWDTSQSTKEYHYLKERPATQPSSSTGPQ